MLGPVRPRIVLAALGLLIAASVLGVVLASRSRPPSGLVDARLRPCPETENCVCSQDLGAEHAIDPLVIRGNPDEAFALLVGQLQAQHELLLLEDAYAHFEVSNWFGLRGDLELLLDRERRQVHVRAASRVGRADLGANRRRVEALRGELAQR
jgi:uncharacterized protein (DUF1499 family)